LFLDENGQGLDGKDVTLGSSPDPASIPYVESLPLEAENWAAGATVRLPTDWKAGKGKRILLLNIRQQHVPQEKGLSTYDEWKGKEGLFTLRLGPTDKGIALFYTQGGADSGKPIAAGPQIASFHVALQRSGQRLRVSLKDQNGKPIPFRANLSNLELPLKGQPVVLTWGLPFKHQEAARARVEVSFDPSTYEPTQAVAGEDPLAEVARLRGENEDLRSRLRNAGSGQKGVPGAAWAGWILFVLLTAAVVFVALDGIHLPPAVTSRVPLFKKLEEPLQELSAGIAEVSSAVSRLQTAILDLKAELPGLVATQISKSLTGGEGSLEARLTREIQAAPTSAAAAESCRTAAKSAVEDVFGENAGGLLETLSHVRTALVTRLEGLPEGAREKPQDSTQDLVIETLERVETLLTRLDAASQRAQQSRMHETRAAQAPPAAMNAEERGNGGTAALPQQTSRDEAELKRQEEAAQVSRALEERARNTSGQTSLLSNSAAHDLLGVYRRREKEVTPEDLETLARDVRETLERLSPEVRKDLRAGLEAVFKRVLHSLPQEAQGRVLGRPATLTPESSRNLEEPPPPGPRAAGGTRVQKGTVFPAGPPSPDAPGNQEGKTSERAGRQERRAGGNAGSTPGPEVRGERLSWQDRWKSYLPHLERARSGEAPELASILLRAASYWQVLVEEWNTLPPVEENLRRWKDPNFLTRLDQHLYAPLLTPGSADSLSRQHRDLVEELNAALEEGQEERKRELLNRFRVERIEGTEGGVVDAYYLEKGSTEPAPEPHLAGTFCRIEPGNGGYVWHDPQGDKTLRPTLAVFYRTEQKGG
jgi:hypothetical protein